MMSGHLEKMIRIVMGLALFFLLGFSPASAGAGTRPLVAFANPGAHDDVFFKPMTDFMRAAAEDLGFDLDVYYGDRNHVLIDENVQAIFNRNPLPDYVVGMNARGSGVNLLKLAEAAGIKTVFINQSFLDEEREMMGYPGDKFKNWLFEYLPDDVESGYLLAKTLIDRALALGLTDDKGVVRILAVSGHETSSASILRERGLRRAVAENPKARLLQVVHAGWKRDRARELAKGLLGRYPHATVFWSASDKMAMGICEGAREIGREPGRDFLTGGVDWASIALGMVESGDFAVTVGGHFMDGAWALVMLHDLINGAMLPKPKTSRFSAISADNIDSYLTHFGSGNWKKIDFSRFSKHANPQLEVYDFSLGAILRQVEDKRMAQ